MRQIHQIRICGGLLVFQKVSENEKEWKYWCDTEAPEEEDIPCGYNATLDVFRKLLLIRAWCPDRTLSQARKYIFDSLGAGISYINSSKLTKLQLLPF